MPNTKKIDKVKDLKEKISKAKSIVFADYIGLSANQLNALRQTLKENNAEAAVAKNTLVKVALEKSAEGEIKDYLKGSTLAVFSYEDAVSGIKTLFEFAKQNELPKVKAGIVDGIFMKQDKLEILSNLPSINELRTQVLRTMKSPINKAVNVLGGVQRKFVYALAGIASAKEKGV